jgi:membrane-bound lytic murein transglycosylase F
MILGFVLGSCSAPPTLLEQVIASGQFRAVTRNSPATFYYGVDEPRGIDYELAKGYADHIGVELHMYVAENFWQIFPDVAEGKAHVGAAGLTVTAPRREIVDFSPAYQTVRQQVIYRRGTRKPNKIKDLLRGELEILAGSAYVGILEAAHRELPQLTWLENREVGIEELVRRVAAGEIDYTIVDSNIFDLLQHSYPDARTAFAVGPDTPIAWALPKTSDTSLRESVSAYFAELHATGELNDILERYYFANKKEFDYVGSRAFVRHFESRLPEYKAYFLAAGERTDVDWRLLAAMAYQESHWNAAAVSPTGVKGIMMLTTRTAGMLGIEDRTDPEQSIRGGAEYFVRVTKKVPERIGEPDRTWLAIAAYNVGFGHLEDARIITEIQGGDPDSWQEVRERLPLLSEPKWFERVPRGYARGHEPMIYVDNVRRYYDILRWMTADDNAVPEEAEILAEATAL